MLNLGVPFWICGAFEMNRRKLSDRQLHGDGQVLVLSIVFNQLLSRKRFIWMSSDILEFLGMNPVSQVGASSCEPTNKARVEPVESIEPGH